MYDVRVDSSKITPNAYPTWDLYVEDGVAPIITGDNEEQQRANVAAFLQLGTIPSLEEVGVDWTGFFTKRLTFGDMDTSVRAALILAGADDFEPQYDIVDDNMYTVIRRVG